MKKGGVDQATANRILKVWEETGAKSPDQLRKMLLGRSARTAAGVLLQTLLDAGMTTGICMLLKLGVTLLALSIRAKVIQSLLSLSKTHYGQDKCQKLVFDMQEHRMVASALELP